MNDTTKPAARKLPAPPGSGPGVNTMSRATYLCAKCQETFSWYKGIKLVATGIALCKTHNPKYKEGPSAE